LFSASKPKAIVFGHAPGLLAPMPTLLSRAGFSVTVVTSLSSFKRCRNVDRLVILRDRTEVLPRVLEEIAMQDYTMVVPGDDDILLELRKARIPAALKLRLLSVCAERALGHIASKIGLSRALEAGGVPTPPYTTAVNRDELPDAIAQLGYPVMVKSDFGAGGWRVRRLNGPGDLAGLDRDFVFPAVVQRAIEGDLFDYSGFYRNGALVYFTEARILGAQRNGGGQSFLRRYTTRPDAQATSHARRLGQALDIDGFSNVSAIKDADGKLWFFEADLRPNAWVEIPRHFGCDPAVRIAEAFGLPPPPEPHPGPVPDHMDIALGLRMRTTDLIVNRYNWRAYYEDYLGEDLVYRRVLDGFSSHIRRALPDWLRRALKLSPRRESPPL
jgi:hypothetical protein